MRRSRDLGTPNQSEPAVGSDAVGSEAEAAALSATTSVDSISLPRTADHALTQLSALPLPLPSALTSAMASASVQPKGKGVHQTVESAARGPQRVTSSVSGHDEELRWFPGSDEEHRASIEWHRNHADTEVHPLNSSPS